MDREAEIAKISHELEILRARHALYERSGRMLKFAFRIWAPLVLVLLLALIIKATVADALMGAFLADMAFVCGLILWLLQQMDPRRFRWIDIASQQASPFSMYPSIPFFLKRGSDAQLIEDQIAERERRLTELGVLP